MILKLVSYEKPKVETSTVTLLVGNYVDLKDYIKVIDPSDDYIESSIIIDDEAVNYYKEGNYIAKVYAINSSGISTEENVEVKVLNKNNYDKYLNNNQSSHDYVYYILALLSFVLIISFIFIILLFVKKKKNNAPN